MFVTANLPCFHPACQSHEETYCSDSATEASLRAKSQGASWRSRRELHVDMGVKRLAQRENESDNISNMRIHPRQALRTSRVPLRMRQRASKQCLFDPRCGEGVLDSCGGERISIESGVAWPRRCSRHWSSCFHEQNARSIHSLLPILVRPTAVWSAESSLRPFVLIPTTPSAGE